MGGHAAQYQIRSVRVDSFKSAKKRKTLTQARKTELADAGFFFAPTDANPDAVKCFLCGACIEDWQAIVKDPLAAHEQEAPSCPLVLVRCFGKRWAHEYEQIEAAAAAAAKPLGRRTGRQAAGKQQKAAAAEDEPARGNFQELLQSRFQPFDEIMVKAREDTFAVGWPHRGRKGWLCTTKMMAESGFVYTPTENENDHAECPYCHLCLDGWEEGDDPIFEHKRRSENCIVFRVQAVLHAGFSGASSSSTSPFASDSTSKEALQANTVSDSDPLVESELEIETEKPKKTVRTVRTRRGAAKEVAPDDGTLAEKRFRTQAEEAPKRTTRSTKAKATAATNPPSNSHAEKQTPATMVEIETAEPGDQPNDDIIDEGPKPKGRTRKPPAQKSTTTVKRLRTRKAQPELEKPVEDPAPPLIADPVEPPPLVQTNADLVPNPARDVPLMADRFAVSSSPNDEAKIAKIDLKKVDASISRQNQNAPHEPKELPASSLTDATSHSLPAAPVKRSENEPAPKGVQFTEPEPAPALRPREQARTKAASAFPTAIDPSATPQAMPYTQLPGFEDDVGRVVSQWKPHDEPALDFGAMLSEMLAGPDSAADVLSQKLGLFRLEHLTAEERKMSVGDYLREVVQRQRARLLREKERMRAALVAESDRLKRRIEAL